MNTDNKRRIDVQQGSGKNFPQWVLDTINAANRWPSTNQHLELVIPFILQIAECLEDPRQSSPRDIYHAKSRCFILTEFLAANVVQRILLSEEISIHHET